MCAQVFAPLARLLGLYGVKQELEELSFKYSNPEAHRMLCNTLQHIRTEQQPTVQQVPFTVQRQKQCTSSDCIIGSRLSWKHTCKCPAPFCRVPCSSLQR